MTIRTLVTGGAGFIGSHLCEALVAKGDRVIALDNLSTGKAANLRSLEGCSSFRLVEADILDSDAVDAAVAGADRVFHLAAAVGVKLVMEHPISTILTNTRGTENVLAACAQTSARVLIASSSEVYGKMGSAQAHPLREDDDWRLGATSTRRWSYACTKALDEFLALAYHDERSLPVVIARLFNTVGPRQRANYGMVIPAFVEAARAGRELVVHGDGTQSRCFNDVGDSVDALMKLMDCPTATGQIVNVGSSCEITINELAHKVIQRFGNRSTPAAIKHVPYADVYGRGFEDMERRTPDLSKLRSLIGATQTLPIDELLARMDQRK